MEEIKDEKKQLDSIAHRCEKHVRNASQAVENAVRSTIPQAYVCDCYLCSKLIWT